jgi:transcriptional regulator with XRE-family HTH domain
MAKDAWEALIRRAGFSSNKEVANAAGMNDGHLWMIVNGKREPRISTAQTLARALGCTLDELVLTIARADADSDEAPRAV